MNYNALEDEKECDGSAKPIHTSLLTFRHAVSATGGLGENHSYFRLDSNLSPPSLLLDCQLNSTQAAAILAL